MNRVLALLACSVVSARGCVTGAPAPSAGAASAAGSATAPRWDAAGPGSPPPGDAAVGVAAASRDLRFRGTVTSIEISRAEGQPDRRWLVTMKVEQVLSGELSGETFAFRVHSPSKSRLAVGQSHTVEARWTGDGYTVDPYQWSSGAGADAG